MYYNGINKKEDINKHYVNETIHTMTDKRPIFPKFDKFDQTKGTWTHIDYNGIEKSSTNLYDFEQSNGLYLKNDLHTYGYKYNRLYNFWKVYDYGKEEYV